KQTFHGISTGNTQELVATPSPETRAAIIQHALANPGPEQQKIRDIKKQLEELQHYAKDDVRQLTQTILVEMVKKAAPQDILDAYMIDHNLQQMNITLETFGMTLDAMQEIMDNAPDSIVTDVGELRLQYRNSRPVVNKFDRDTISVLSGDVRLPDGREVYFIYSGEDSRKKREYTLAQLKSLLSVSV
ncbi:MAG: hypothetical protein ABIR91_05630, partial [Candidatus Saccharimonadales bacterium]